MSPKPADAFTNFSNHTSSANNQEIDNNKASRRAYDNKNNHRTYCLSNRWVYQQERVNNYEWSNSKKKSKAWF